MTRAAHRGRRRSKRASRRPAGDVNASVLPSAQKRRAHGRAPSSRTCCVYSLRVAIGGIGPLVSIPCTSATDPMNHRSNSSSDDAAFAKKLSAPGPSVMTSTRKPPSVSAVDTHGAPSTRGARSDRQMPPFAGHSVRRPRLPTHRVCPPQVVLPFPAWCPILPCRTFDCDTLAHPSWEVKRGAIVDDLWAKHAMRPQARSSELSPAPVRGGSHRLSHRPHASAARGRR